MRSGGSCHTAAAKGGVAVDPSKLSRPRKLEAVSRRYMQGNDPVRRSAHRPSWARTMGTNEQIMAWFMDTYSVYMGSTP